MKKATTPAISSIVGILLFGPRNQSSICGHSQANLLPVDASVVPGQTLSTRTPSVPASSTALDARATAPV